MTRPIWSMSRCFLEKKRCRRPLSERHDATLDLYSSLSRFTTRGRQRETGDKRANGPVSKMWSLDVLAEVRAQNENNNKII